MANQQLIQCPACQKTVSLPWLNLHLDNECQKDDQTSKPSHVIGGSNVNEEAGQTPGLHHRKRKAQFQDLNGDEHKDSLQGKRQSTRGGTLGPLANRSRPTGLSQFIGQPKLLGPNTLLRRLLTADPPIPISCILWGPPGSGKTTLARIMARECDCLLREMSATESSISDVRKIFEEAAGPTKLGLTVRKTMIFLDEIHRFTKSQQDIFLPYVEQGKIILVGATTENPSFRINNALLSRCRVFLLEKHSVEFTEEILRSGLLTWCSDSGGDESDQLQPEVITFLANVADGDARTALNLLEMVMTGYTRDHRRLAEIPVEEIIDTIKKDHLVYDRLGDAHYDTISALHKSIRGSDPDASLYWLGRMLEGGEDPLYIARRLVRACSEDIGLAADPQLFNMCMSAFQACHVIGMPECDTILAEVVVRLAEAPKSTRVYKAYGRVKALLKDPKHSHYPVPLHIRNAPTSLLKSLGHADGYIYPPDHDYIKKPQRYLPEELGNIHFLDVSREESEGSRVESGM